jgi:hypothetical protein
LLLTSVPTFGASADEVGGKLPFGHCKRTISAHKSVSRSAVL